MAAPSRGLLLAAAAEQGELDETGVSGVAEAGVARCKAVTETIE